MDKQLPQGTLNVKLIFNPGSGRAGESPRQLSELVACMQREDMLPEVHLVQPGDDITAVSAEAVARGFPLVVASGGDGTVSAAAGGVIGTGACLGIIPTGTQNNQALALGIPGEIEAAVQLLRRGEIRQIDTGRVSCPLRNMPLIEIASIGLTSALFPSSDAIQHGELGKVGEFFQQLFDHPPVRIHADLDGGRAQVEVEAHTMLVTNMPYTGARWRMADNVSCSDGLLDVFFFPEMSKLDLINAVFQATAAVPEDDRIWHYQVKRADFTTLQPAPVMVDGVMLDSCALSVEVLPGSLKVIANPNLGVD